ncbi:MAG: hypothetical protein AAF988_07840 [Pseudomonadota bacterium]
MGDPPLTSDPASQETTQTPAQRALRQIKKLCAGNGIDPNSIELIQDKMEVIEMEGLTHLEIDLATSQEERVGRLEQGSFHSTMEAMNAAITETQNKLTKNQESRKFIADQVLNRPDKGFALHGETLELKELIQDFSTHAPCNSCGGAGKKTCKSCGGQRQVSCTQCHGRTMIQCRHCLGQGMTQGPNGQQQQCNFCFGQRQVSCPLCQKTGRMQCRSCSGQGQIKCDPCKGGGIFTIIVSIMPIVKTLFEMDRAELPHAIVGAFERNGARLASHDHFRFTAEQVTRKDEGLALQYQSRFAYSNAIARIGSQPVKFEVFGEKAKIIKTKPFLEELIKPGLSVLKKAANNVSAGPNIKRASQYDLISKAVRLTVEAPRKKQALINLRKLYPIGIRPQVLQGLIQMSEKALGNITQKPRVIGLGAGLLLATAIYLVFYMGGFYAGLKDSLSSALDMALSVILIIAGGGIAHFMIKFMAGMAMRKALGDLLPNTKKKKSAARSYSMKIYAYAGAAVLFLASIEIARQTGHIIPDWYPF